MKKKKVTIIISYDYDNKDVSINQEIAEKIKRDLLRGINPIHEAIESVIVEDES